MLINILSTHQYYLESIVCDHEPLADVERTPVAHHLRTDDSAEQQVEHGHDPGGDGAGHERPGVHSWVAMLQGQVRFDKIWHIIRCQEVYKWTRGEISPCFVTETRVHH